MVILLDSSAWVEFFIKSEKGQAVKRYLDIGECYTSIVTLAEISNWAMRENLNGKDLIKFIINSSKISDLNFEISFLAGELNFQRKKIVKNWGMIDSLILATSLIYGLKILTKDSHFRSLENVEIL
ncbi:PIN domain-containing protein [Candidatus Woesearchaeota archaeon]|nr:PIN domain-containing protein [Candidatus Woesearchaeota archaeon]